MRVVLAPEPLLMTRSEAGLPGPPDAEVLVARVSGALGRWVEIVVPIQCAVPDLPPTPRQCARCGEWDCGGFCGRWNR